MSDSLQASDDQLYSLFQESLDDDTSGLEEISPLLDSVSDKNERYTDRQLIAAGGMKKIYKVFDQKTGRYVALAELHDELPVEVYEPFLLEARLTGLLEHPNIITVHDIGLSSGRTPFFTMELKIGDSLQEILEALKNNKSDNLQNFSRIDLLNIFIKICDAIAYAHSRAVIHLDLKPDNIQIGAFGEVLVCDWGLGKVLGNAIFEDYEALTLNPDFLNNITLTGDVKGTPGYMAPEQISGKDNKTPQCDIYALGAILYAILTNEAPLRGDTEPVLKRTLSGDIKAPHTLTAQNDIPHSLSAVAMKALRKDPSKRYQNINELRLEVSQFLAGYATEAQNANLFTEMSLFTKRNKAACLIALFSLLITIGGTLVFIGNLHRTMGREAQARKFAEQEQKRAEESLNLYKEQQKRADTAVKRYLKSKEWSEKYIHDSAREVMFQIYKQTDVDVYGEPVKSLERALKTLDKLTKDREDILPEVLVTQQAYIYFIRQQFRLCSLLPYNLTPLREVSQMFAGRVQKNGLLSPEDFSQMINAFKVQRYSHHKQMAIKMVCYDGAVRKDIREHAKILHILLKLFNDKWVNGVFDYKAKKAHLSIKGKGIFKVAIRARTNRQQLSYHYCFLRSLKLRSLDISETDFAELEQLEGLLFKRLNISNTKVLKLDTIKHFTELKELTVSKGQFTDKELKKIPSRIRVNSSAFIAP